MFKFIRTVLSPMSHNDLEVDRRTNGDLETIAFMCIRELYRRNQNLKGNRASELCDLMPGYCLNSLELELSTRNR